MFPLVTQEGYRPAVLDEICGGLATKLDRAGRPPAEPEQDAFSIAQVSSYNAVCSALAAAMRWAQALHALAGMRPVS